MERHPTDASGKYIKAGDSKPRVARGGFMMVSDDEIAWFEVGDVLEAPFGCGYIERIDYACCWYVVRTHQGLVSVPFEDARRATENPGHC